MAAVRAADVYDKITADIIKAIESGEAGTWMKPWIADAGMPRNVVTGNAYSGGNVLVLWFTGELKGYATQEWATYRQWEGKGAQVRSKEKATHLVRWQTSRCKGTPKDHRCKDCGNLFPIPFAVFNAAQVDGYTPEAPAEGLSESERLAIAEEWFKAIGADVRNGGNRAAYAPAQDYILMPMFADFKDGASYYATMAHEHTHWTGHESRLNRDLNNRFGTDAYAAEELIAELGAAFVCATLGIATTPRPDHASYLAHWLTILRADSKAIFFAAGQASKAVDHLVETAKASSLTTAA